jgi:hypothetical protein
LPPQILRLHQNQVIWKKKMRNQEDHFCDIARSTRYLNASSANNNDNNRDVDGDDIFAAVSQIGLTMPDLMLPTLEESCIQQQTPHGNHISRMMFPYVPRASLPPPCHVLTRCRRSSLVRGHDDNDWKAMDPTSVVFMDFHKHYRVDRSIHDHPLDHHHVLLAPVIEPDDMALRLQIEEEETQPFSWGTLCDVKASNTKR